MVDDERDKVPTQFALPVNLLDVVADCLRCRCVPCSVELTGPLWCKDPWLKGGGKRKLRE